MRALITGITGQVGSFMADYLVEKKVEVYGLIRRTSKTNTKNIEHLLREEKIELVSGDLTDNSSIDRVFKEIEPDEIYNFAAQSFIPYSFISPLYTADVTGVGVVRLLESMKKYCESSKFYQASSSEMFGNVEGLITENTPLSPLSPYAAAKAYAHNMCKIYRKAYKLFISCGISFNCESERRGEEFVTRKITKTAAEIAKKKKKEIRLGNIYAKRDFGYARDYVKAMYLIMQQKEPDDYIIATGESHFIKEFLEKSFSLLGLDYRDYLVIDKNLYRPVEVHDLRGDSSKLKKLGWKPETTFEELIRIMVTYDYAREDR